MVLRLFYKFEFVELNAKCKAQSAKCRNCVAIIIKLIWSTVGAGKSHLPVRSVLLLRRGVHRTPAPVPARNRQKALRSGTETRPYITTRLVYR